MVLLWFGKRGIMVYETEEPLKLPLWSYLLIFFLCIIPIINIMLTLGLITAIWIKFALYEDRITHYHSYYHNDGWYVKEGKKNWIWSMYKLFTKKL